MIVCFDFDGTFAADPVCMGKIRDTLVQHGHTVILCTQRSENFRSDVEEIWGTELPVVYASGVAKKTACAKAGYKVDIWIEDNPASVELPLVYSGDLPNEPVAQPERERVIIRRHEPDPS